MPGSSMNFRRIFAIRLPCSASRRTFASLREMTAISDAAKKAFDKMAKKRIRICHPSSVDSGSIGTGVFKVVYFWFWKRMAADL